MDRQSNGRFVPGHGIKSPGRPPRATEATYLRTFSDKLTLDRWEKIVEAAISAAEEGDATARNWIARFCMPENYTLARLAREEPNDENPLEAASALTQRYAELIEMLGENDND